MGRGKGTRSAVKCLCAAAAFLVSGAACSRNEVPANTSTNGPSAAQHRSGMGLVIEDLAGRTDTRAGLRAQETIRRVSRQEQQALDEAMER